MNMDDSFFSLSGPIELTPGPGRTRAASFQKFFDYVLHLGGDPRAILERHDIDPLRVGDPEHHISSRAMVDTFQYCASTLDAPLFGFHLAELQSPDVFGCVSTLCRTAPDIRRAMQDFIDFLPVVHSPEYEVTLAEAGDVVELRWFRHSEDYDAYDQVNHHALLRVVNLFRSLAPDDFRLRYANISTALSADARARIEGGVGCTVHADQNVDLIGMEASSLSAPLPSTNRLVHELLSGYLQRVKAARHLSLRDRVEAYVRGALRQGECSATRCAEKLGMSTRTLQHQLHSAHVSFSEIVSAQRMELAKIYLVEDRLPVAEVALKLGYSEQASFGRAFKKWTGQSPSHLRMLSKQVESSADQAPRKATKSNHGE